MLWTGQSLPTGKELMKSKEPKLLDGLLVCEQHSLLWFSRLVPCESPGDLWTYVCFQWTSLLKSLNRWGWNNGSVSGTNGTMVYFPFTFFLYFIVSDSHVYFELTSIHSVPECRSFIMLSYWITGKYQIITFEEYILIALYADRIVGIYPEIKNPVFINQHVSSFDMARLQRKLFTLVM